MPLDLREAARREMIHEGFAPDFPPATGEELASLDAAPSLGAGVKDLRHLLWSSVDNPESRDLDQVEYAEMTGPDQIKVLIGIADVDCLIRQAGPIDLHASRNTTSVYCGVTMFPMLPEAVSTGLTSLNQAVDRLVVVIELVVAADGTVAGRDAYRALIHNHAQLDYPSIGAWLEDRGPAPPKVAAAPAAMPSASSAHRPLTPAASRPGPASWQITPFGFTRSGQRIDNMPQNDAPISTSAVLLRSSEKVMESITMMRPDRV